MHATLPQRALHEANKIVRGRVSISNECNHTWSLIPDELRKNIQQKCNSPTKIKN